MSDVRLTPMTTSTPWPKRQATVAAPMQPVNQVTRTLVMESLASPTAWFARSAIVAVWSGGLMRAGDAGQRWRDSGEVFLKILPKQCCGSGGNLTLHDGIALD